MALTYTCEPDTMEMALERLKADGLVDQEAAFNPDAPGGLRREVAYRDFDFLSRLGRVGEAETVQSALAWLARAGLVPPGAGYDEAAFEALQREVKEKFTIPGTSISPVMARLLYALSAVRRPRRAIGLGTYCGYALVWAVGASCGPEPLYEAETVCGIDIDAESTARARENFDALAGVDHVELIAEDGLAAVERLAGPFDYVFLDVESRALGKGIYLDLLERLYDKLEAGAWVLAHDTAVPPFAGQLAGYLAFVRDGARFVESVSFDVDPFGVELSIR